MDEPSTASLVDIPELPEAAKRIARPTPVRPMSIGGLRAALGVTQVEMAARLEMTQPEVSRFEGRGDHKLSMLRRYVEAIGGELELTVVINGQRMRVSG